MTTTSVIRVCGVSMDASFHDGSNETIRGCDRLRRPEISPFWFEVVLRPQGPLNRVCGVSRLLMHLFMVVTMTPSAAASDPGGRRNCCLIVSCHCEKFIIGVIDTSDKIVTIVLSSVS